MPTEVARGGNIGETLVERPANRNNPRSTTIVNEPQCFHSDRPEQRLIRDPRNVVVVVIKVDLHQKIDDRQILNIEGEWRPLTLGVRHFLERTRASKQRSCVQCC